MNFSILEKYFFLLKFEININIPFLIPCFLEHSLDFFAKKLPTLICNQGLVN